MIVNVEVLLTISADSLDEADALAEYIVKDIAEVYGPENASPDDVFPGVIATASVEAIAEKRRAA